MTAYNVVLKNKVQGILTFLNRNRAAGHIRNNSLCRMAIPSRGKSVRLFGLFAVYDIHDIVRVTARSAGGTHAFRRLFVSRSFPYLSRRWVPDKTYKTFWFLTARVATGDTLEIAIETEAEGQAASVIPVCTASVMKIKGAAPDFSDVMRRVEGFLVDAKDGEPTRQEFTELLLDLERATPPQSSPDYNDWLRTFIRLNASQHCNHRPSRRGLARLENRLAAENGQQEYQAFVDQLSALTSPYLMGPHGFRLSFAASKREDLISELMGVIEVLRQLGAESFVNSGTLLGLHRDRDLIWYDDDFDLAVIVPGDSMDEVKANWRRLAKEIRPHYEVMYKGMFFAVRIGGEYEVDLFPAWSLDQKFYVYPYMFGELGSDAVLPLKALSIDGIDLPVPAREADVLSVNYGPDWQTPDPHWKFDWVGANKRFSTARRELSLHHLKHPSTENEHG